MNKGTITFRDMTSQNNCDEYGFCRSQDFDHKQQEEFMKSYIRVLATRRKKWDNGFINWESARSTINKKLKGIIIYLI